MTNQESSLAERSRALREMARIQRGVPYQEVSPPPRQPRLSRTETQKRREQEQLSTHEVYFLYSCNRIKIGTSRHAQRRILTAIAPYCAGPLIIVGTIPGGPIVEARLHVQFRAAELSNEWFDLAPGLRAFLCEDKKRARRLARAEEEYREWLRKELQYQETINVDLRD